ncbi:MAG: hypothetical protein A2511_14870 [Deltaproteobacteria bacterium RIFOXYD12_FULL_50_9]|nr:MAG: hypothetical protein A2511_14870 [Deltaproteobacteria bacterium RIFOXYD12_FULL_50_9]
MDIAGAGVKGRLSRWTETIGAQDDKSKAISKTTALRLVFGESMIMKLPIIIDSPLKTDAEMYDPNYYKSQLCAYDNDRRQ